MAEKSSSEISRDLRALFIKGNEALQRDNADYAIALFTQVLQKEPALYDCRKALRVAQQQKAAQAGRGFFKKMFSSASASPQLLKAQATLRGNPTEAMHTAEQVLNQDPNNTLAHKVFAEAAVAAGLSRSALLSFEVLHQHAPQDKRLGIQFATALAEAGEVARGEQVLVELARAFPNDNELSQELKNLSARKTLDEGGYEALADGKGSYRDILKDKEQAAALEQEQRIQKTEDVAARLIGEYEARLPNEPNNLKLLRSLAELYTQKKDFDRALQYYDRIRATDVGGSDPSLDRAIAETVARRFDHALAALDPEAPDYAEQSAKLAAEKQAFQLSECQKRVERFPTDLGIRFELGQLLFEAGRIGEAIAEFQKAQNNPHKRLPAMSYLAQCFARRKMYDLAAKILQNALKEKTVFDEEKKELLYQLGLVLESMGRKGDAIEQLKLIYEVDIGYKDVAARVDAFYAES
ncbi:MAG TPA: tetratricopeptide repeat protein [Verrucomicrobiota bacterium]|nr:tetratricopeptide repeat protein [Verrucomicrobiota bacterium]HQB17017.1 tetratricopeptide repeat protein [Verrucomicrobiota bacterium]